MSPKFSIYEDFSQGLCPQFNSDGEISSLEIPLIENGMLKNTLVSSRSGKEYGVKTNFAEGGEYLRSPKMKHGELNHKNVLKSIDNKAKYKVIGIRPGEKIHEELITESDSINTLEYKNYFVIFCVFFNQF